MTTSDGGNLPANGQFLVYTAEDGRVKIEVRLQGETIWLTQTHMAELFGTTQQNISLHLQNIYDEEELLREATHKEFLSVRREGEGEAAMSRRTWSHSTRELEQTIAANVAEILET